MKEKERIQAIVDQFIKEAGATTLADYETILRTLRNKGLHGSAQNQYENRLIYAEIKRRWSLLQRSQQISMPKGYKGES
jgi:hypothetical protein